MQSLVLSLGDPLGPGPGFFPFCLSLVGGALAAMLFLQVRRWTEVARAAVLPDRAGGVRIAEILLGLVVATAVLEPLGFRLTLLLLNAYLLVALGVRNVWVTVVFALMGSFGVFHVFYYWLKVPLPIGALGM
jgi:putative tricarboxylic transport membrane protein